jgi:hypothetical protein
MWIVADPYLRHWPIGMSLGASHFMPPISQNLFKCKGNIVYAILNLSMPRLVYGELPPKK